MKLNFDKSGLTLVLISITGLLFQTSGFDFYAHSISYSFIYPLNWGYFIGEKSFYHVIYSFQIFMNYFL